MKSSTRTLISLAAALIAAAAIFAYATAIERELSAARGDAVANYGENIVAVLVARQDIPAGATISEDVFERVDWPTALLPKDVAIDPDVLENKVATAMILAGEPITGSRVGESASMLHVPRGFTAVSVPSEDVRAVGGAVEAGSVVDVYAVVDGAASLLESGISVLETSVVEKTGRIGSSKSPISWVTLAVPADSAQQVIVASEVGTLHFALPSIGR